MAMGVVQPSPKAKPKKISNFFLALGGGQTTPRAVGWLRPPQIGQSGVAKATPWLTCGGRPPIVFDLLFWFFIIFIFIFFLKSNYYFINIYSGARGDL
jgi:hypothetical protein